MNYIGIEHLSVVEKSLISKAFLWQNFMEQPYSVVYVVATTGELDGIISMGDFVRNFQKKIYVNQKYAKLYNDSISMESRAEQFFQENPNRNQIPVLDGENKLVGEYRREIKSLQELSQEEKQKALVKQYMKICNLDVIVLTEEISVKLWRLKYNSVFSLREMAMCAENFFQLYNLMIDLKEKEIPVMFWERPETGELGSYSEKACRRIKDGISFIKMSESVEQYQDELKELIGSKFSRHYIEGLCKIPPILNRGADCIHADCESEYINVVNGRRITIPQVDNFEHTVYMYGRCGVFGYAVEDKDTLPSALQKRLFEAEIPYRVVNCGLWGAGNRQILQNLERAIHILKKGDVVILYMQPLAEEEARALEHMGMSFYDCTEKYYENTTDRELFYDKPGHMTVRGYDVIAGQMFAVLQKKGNRSQTLNEENVAKKVELENREDRTFENKINAYVEKIRKKYKIDYNSKRIGAIVMNCNPFTLGHYYLIESSAQKVDYLFVFVVEEDKSYFPFMDRYKMVIEGTKNLANVLVVPSGQFIIASETFPEYFMKEQLKEVCLDASKDLTIFAQYIAHGLNISVRFAGEEPFDPLTRQYNDAMREILPAYKIAFDEIPRKKQDNKVISASVVRKLMQENRNEEIRKIVPMTTYNYLLDKGLLKNEQANQD